TLVELLGYPDAETLFAQESMVSMFPQEKTLAWLAKLQREGGLRNEEIQVPTYDGRRIWVRLNVRSVLDEAGRLESYEGSVADVTAEKEATEALRRTRDRLEFVLRMSPTILYALDPGSPADLTFISSNVSWLLGYEPEECLRDPDWWIKNVHPEDRERMLAELPGPLFETGQRSHEFRFRHKDGHYRWIRDEVRLVRGPDDAPQEIVGAWLDVTEQKQAELEIQRRTRHLEALNRIISAAAAATSRDELFEAILEELRRALDVDITTIWTQDAALMKGAPVELRDALRREVYSRSPRFSAPHVVDDWQALVPTTDFQRRMAQVLDRFGIRASVVAPLILAEGRIGGLAVAAGSPRRWLDDEVELLVAVGQQIAAAVERLQLLERVQEQARLLQRIMDTAPDGIILLDREHKVILANPTGRRLLDDLAHTDEAGRVVRLGDRALDELLHPTPQEALTELRVAKEGMERVFELAAQPLEPVADATNWLLDIREVTRLREMQKEAEQQARLAAVGQLAAGIAHDFNNILGAILLFSHALETEPGLTERGRERAITIRRASERASQLINQILDFSRSSMLDQR
ncbi:MAG: PAS domain S-box protein, partial [Caldilineae bacterium]